MHGDIKPSNLLLSREGAVKVVDLGLGRLLDDQSFREQLTTQGEFLGTPDFMAPEQIDGSHKVDIRTDIFSLGCTCYTLLTGHGPFGHSEQATLLSRLNSQVRDPVMPIQDFRPEVPEALAAVLERMLARSPEKRFATPQEVAHALEPFAAGQDLTELAAQNESIDAVLRSEAALRARTRPMPPRAEPDRPSRGSRPPSNGATEVPRRMRPFLGLLILGVLVCGIAVVYLFWPGGTWTLPLGSPAGC